MISAIRSAASDPWRAITYLIDKIYSRVTLLRQNITAPTSLVIRGWPMIDVRNGCSLIIGNNVTLNSRNRGYHINMHSPVKILADRKGAVISIGSGTRIHGTCIHAYKSIDIGRNCLIAANTQIFDGNGHDTSMADAANRLNTAGDSKPIVIGDNVWIGANCILLPGVRIGADSIIAAGSVVSGEIPTRVIAAGNPASVIRTF